MVLLIQEKIKVNVLTLKAVTSKDKLHPLIEKKEWKTTLISEVKTCYLYVDKESSNYNFSSLYEYFVSFASNDEKSWNIDIQSLTGKNLSEIEVIQVVSEGILFGSHKTVNWKQKKVSESKIHSCSERSCDEVQAKVSSCKQVSKDKYEEPKGSYEIIIEYTKKTKNYVKNFFYYGLKTYGEKEEPKKGKTYNFYIHGKSPLGFPWVHDWQSIEPEKAKENDYCLITKNKGAQAILDNSFIKLSAVNWARDLQDTPPNKLRAKEFSETVKDKFNKLKSIEVEILDKKQIEKSKMGLLLAVNAGSHHEPRVVILRYKGNPKSKEILGLVGKGITFDSGGYNLKPSQALQCMKFDMSGAAVVCSSFLSLAQKKPKINVVAVACLTENAIGGHATLTESVITSMSGKTVEINNTDAEGRLVLADGITYAIEKEKVNKIITVATLTGACALALGENATGIMTNNRDFYQQFCQATQKSYEKIWELPIWPENTKNLKENTTIADISNISSSRYMGASNGAAFLQYFVKELPFIHCDIAGTASKTKTKRGTGVMVRTLIELFSTIK